MLGKMQQAEVIFAVAVEYVVNGQLHDDVAARGEIAAEIVLHLRADQ